MPSVSLAPALLARLAIFFAAGLAPGALAVPVAVRPESGRIDLCQHMKHDWKIILVPNSTAILNEEVINNNALTFS